MPTAEHFPYWLCARRRALDVRSRRQRQAVLTADGDIDALRDDPLIDRSADPNMSEPEQWIDARVDRERARAVAREALVQALREANLSPVEHQVLELAVRGLSNAEIAAEMHRDKKTVDNALVRARRRMRQHGPLRATYRRISAALLACLLLIRPARAARLWGSRRHRGRWAVAGGLVFVGMLLPSGMSRLVDRGGSLHTDRSGLLVAASRTPADSNAASELGSEPLDTADAPVAVLEALPVAGTRKRLLHRARGESSRGAPRARRDVPPRGLQGSAPLQLEHTVQAGPADSTRSERRFAARFEAVRASASTTARMAARSQILAEEPAHPLVDIVRSEQVVEAAMLDRPEQVRETLSSGLTDAAVAHWAGAWLAARTGECSRISGLRRSVGRAHRADLRHGARLGAKQRRKSGERRCIDK